MSPVDEPTEGLWADCTDRSTYPEMWYLRRSTLVLILRAVVPICSIRRADTVDRLSTETLNV